MSQENGNKSKFFSNPSVAFVILILFILVTSVFFMIGNIYNQPAEAYDTGIQENSDKVKSEKQIADNIKATKSYTDQHNDTENIIGNTALSTTENNNESTIEAPAGSTANTVTSKVNNSSGNSSSGTSYSSSPSTSSSNSDSPGPKHTPALTSFLADKLLPSKEEDKSSRQIQTWTGWLIDRDCIGVNPLKHTAACNLMGSEDTPPTSCYTSGIGIVEYVPGKAFTSYNTFDNFHVFDESSRTIVKAFIESLPEGWINNITVKVTGYTVDNIPANADETNVPETDPSKIDHYLKGIHINKIEAAFIDGVSTNVLPTPNLVLPK